MRLSFPEFGLAQAISFPVSVITATLPTQFTNSSLHPIRHFLISKQFPDSCIHLARERELRNEKYCEFAHPLITFFIFHFFDPFAEVPYACYKHPRGVSPFTFLYCLAWRAITSLESSSSGVRSLLCSPLFPCSLAFSSLPESTGTRRQAITSKRGSRVGRAKHCADILTSSLLLGEKEWENGRDDSLSLGKSSELED